MKTQPNLFDSNKSHKKNTQNCDTKSPLISKKQFNLFKTNLDFGCNSSALNSNHDVKNEFGAYHNEKNLNYKLQKQKKTDFDTNDFYAWNSKSNSSFNSLKSGSISLEIVNTKNNFNSKKLVGIQTVSNSQEDDAESLFNKEISEYINNLDTGNHKEIINEVNNFVGTNSNLLKDNKPAFLNDSSKSN